MAYGLTTIFWRQSLANIGYGTRLEGDKPMFKVSVSGGKDGRVEASDFESFPDAESFARKLVLEQDSVGTARVCQIFHGTQLAATVQVDAAGKAWTDVESAYASLI
jgi:hypothetical protein